MSDNVVQTLIARVRAAASQRERAVLERELYEALPPEMRVNRRGGLAGALRVLDIGDSYTHIKSRLQLLRAGVEAQPLWDAIDKGVISVTAARDMLEEACKFTTMPRGAAVVRILDERLNAKTTPRVTPYGVVQARCPTRKHRGINGATPAAFRAGVYALAAELVAAQHLDDGAAARLLDMLQANLSMLISDFNTAIRRVKDKPALELTVAVTRGRVIAACQTLAMDPPKPGMPVDTGLARRQRGKLGRLYHPDVNGGGDHRADYEAVMKAFEDLVSYNDSLTQTGESDNAQR